jgi:uroporphyrinogen decarboxylase
VKTKREIIKMVLDGKQAPYIPWSLKFTVEPTLLLQSYYGREDIDSAVDKHILNLGSDIVFFEDLGNNYRRDVFNVVWDKSVDKDIGIPVEPVLKKPDLDELTIPDPYDLRFYSDINDRINKHPDMFRVFQIGFSLFERAWTLRGMENLLMDFFVNPVFVNMLFTKIADYNIAQVKSALEYDIDAVYCGDYWGQRSGLIMGYDLWKGFIYTQLKSMYGAVKESGKYIMIHSSGDVDELFDKLIEIGVDCCNPFQPEVMDVFSLIDQYRGKMTFHGGLSMQKTLPFGTQDDVQKEMEKLIEAGMKGGLIFSPSHSVEGDTFLQNILTFIDRIKKQPGYLGKI